MWPEAMMKAMLASCKPLSSGLSLFSRNETEFIEENHVVHDATIYLREAGDDNE